MGFLSRFRVPTPRPSLAPAEESIEAAMCRLRASTDRLEDLLLLLRSESEEARAAAAQESINDGS